MVNIIVNSDSKYQIDKLAVQNAAVEVLQRHKIFKDVEISISIVGDKKMHEINRKYRGINATTNILSFPLEDSLSQTQLQHVPKMGFVKAPDNVLRLGDVIISYPQVEQDASREGVSTEEELRFLIEHGISHLLGVHHT